jgi:hypothetical protein
VHVSWTNLPAHTMPSWALPFARATHRGALATSSKMRPHLGFVVGVIPGRMVLPASEEGQAPVLVLSFDSQAALAEDPAQSAIRDITLHLDVAQVARAEHPFERMREAAFTLASTMDGVVTDDNGQPLAAQTMDVIGAELQVLYDTLEQRDLAAGSMLARRLFS